MGPLNTPAFAKLDQLNYISRSLNYHENALTQYGGLNLTPCNLREYHSQAKAWLTSKPRGLVYVAGLLLDLYAKGYGRFYIRLQELKKWTQRRTNCITLIERRSRGVDKAFPICVRNCSKQVTGFDTLEYFGKRDIQSASIESLILLMIGD